MLASQVPPTPEHYPNIEIAGAPALPPEEQAQWKAIAHTEGLAPTEWNQFMVALGVAHNDVQRGYQVNDAYNEQTITQLKKAWGPEFDRNLAFARAETKALLERHPELHDLFTNTVVGSNPFVVRILADRGARRAARR